MSAKTLKITNTLMEIVRGLPVLIKHVSFELTGHMEKQSASFESNFVAVNAKIDKVDTEFAGVDSKK